MRHLYKYAENSHSEQREAEPFSGVTVEMNEKMHHISF